MFFPSRYIYRILLLLLCMGPGRLVGQEGGVPREHHPWGRFQPGAWKLVRVTTETFEEGGTMTSFTETKTTLKEVNKNGVTLLIEVGVQVAGKRFETQPYMVKQNFFGELADHPAKVTDLGPAEATVQGRKIACRVYELEIRNTASRTVTKVHYSDSVEPFILKRQSVRTEPESGDVLADTDVEVIATNVPYRVLGDLRNCCNVRWVHEHPQGKSTTVAVTCTDVPGGVVCHTLKEVDTGGGMVRRSALELIDYGFQPDETRQRLFRRRRPLRRSTYRYGPY